LALAGFSCWHCAQNIHRLHSLAGHDREAMLEA
jgi:hypothetical protein